jgi:hypothetical protein
MQVYQQSFSDAFAALLDLPSANTHPMVYLYCLEEAMNADGQLTDVLMPGHHVNMDSSVIWDIVSVKSLTSASSNKSNVHPPQMQGPQDQLHGRSYLDTGLRSDESAFLRVKTNMQAYQQPRVAVLSLQHDFMTTSIRHLKSSEFDHFSLFDDDDADKEHHNTFEEEHLGLQKMPQFPDNST